MSIISVYTFLYRSLSVFQFTFFLFDIMDIDIKYYIILYSRKFPDNVFRIPCITAQTVSQERNRQNI